MPFRSRNAQLGANPAAQQVIDVVVHRHDGFLPVGHVAKLRMTSFLAASGKATVLVEVLDELAFLHALTRILRWNTLWLR